MLPPKRQIPNPKSRDGTVIQEMSKYIHCCIFTCLNINASVFRKIVLISSYGSDTESEEELESNVSDTPKENIEVLKLL